MTTPTSHNNLPAQQAGFGTTGLGTTALDTLAASDRSTPRPHPRKSANAALGGMVDRIRSLMAGSSSVASVAAPSPAAAARSRAIATPAAGTRQAVPAGGCPGSFVPQEPKSFRAAGLNDSLVESLALKHLLARGDSTGREMADQLKLPFILLDELLRGLKNDQLVVYRAARR